MKTGVVYHRNLLRALFVVEIEDGSYSVFESFNTREFNIGDQIAGSLQQIGTVILLNATTQKTETVIVRKFKLPLSEAMDYANLNDR